MDYRETTVTVFGETRTIRTERTGRVRTDRQLESAHTKAVRAALTAMHEAGKADALAAAEKAARKAEHAARHDHSGPLFDAAREARARVDGIRRRKFTAPSCPDLKARLRPEPVRFDLTPDDPLFADIHEYIDPDAPAAVDEQPDDDTQPTFDLQEWLDRFFDPNAALTA
ncbi:hypothetical protein H114_32639 [Streptomyces gancidicus BKS 13-15]|uniref:Uncharacterized protein n=1 Tax=Streptomyces gancidicus BKS 13-15 TaxID=1284664 RepID=M3B9H3_STREZ|nr:hypothetical protein [Streptomyces gancidicus]EMF20389.1 hypothetical protein H114_32639 [Streptomyces gancidicus BKS 13-15]